MIKIAFAQSVSKQYLLMQETMRRNKKLVSMVKLVVVGGIFFVVLGTYARHVTLSSTKGYFLREHMQEYDSLEFDRSIVKLDVLKLEKKVFDSIPENSVSRYGRQDRIEGVVVNSDPIKTPLDWKTIQQ